MKHFVLNFISNSFCCTTCVPNSGRQPLGVFAPCSAMTKHMHETWETRAHACRCNYYVVIPWNILGNFKYLAGQMSVKLFSNVQAGYKMSNANNVLGLCHKFFTTHSLKIFPNAVVVQPNKNMYMLFSILLFTN